MLRSWRAHSSATSFPCVGVVVVAGCFLLVFAPDDPPKPALFPPRLPPVVIDAGHGGNDDGAKTRSVVEKEATLDLARRLDAILRLRGFETVMTRRDDRYVALDHRVAVANRLDGPPLFISLHFNKAGSPSIGGIETFYTPSKKLPPVSPPGWKGIGFFNPPSLPDSGEYLAGDVQLAAIAKTGARNRGIRARNLFVTSRTCCPAILVEGGFISHSMERYLLGSSLYMDRLAEGIADGIENWCRMQPGALPPPLAEKAAPSETLPRSPGSSEPPASPEPSPEPGNP